MTRFAVLVGVAVLLALHPLPAAADPSSPEERAAAVARPGVVFLSVTWRGWVRDKRTGEVFGGTGGYEVKTACSGAVISPDGYVATASHCVHTGPLGGGGALFEAAIADLAEVGRVRDVAKARQDFAERGSAEGATPDSPVDRRIQVERVEARDGGEVRDIAPATVVDLVAPEDGDVAVLRVPRRNLPSIAIRDDPAPVGTPILAIGYPGSTSTAVDPSLEPSNKDGRISARRTQGGRPFYEFSAAATRGMSGGPVVDVRGDVVGLISQGSPGETQAFNLAASTRTLVEVLRAGRLQVGTGPHDQDFRAGLDRYYEGDYDGAVEHFDAAIAGSPGHRQAAEFRRLAADKGGVAGSSPTTLLVVLAIACGGLAVAAATAGTAVLVTRRRRLAGRSPTTTTPYGAAPPAGGFPAAAAPPAAGYHPTSPPGIGFPGAATASPTPTARPANGSPSEGVRSEAPTASYSNPERVPAPEDGPTTHRSGLPVVLGVEPQTDRQGEADQTERVERALGQQQADDQAEHAADDVHPRTPLAGQPSADQADEGDQAHHDDERHRP
ncbi:S1 family peptidase [Saccharothrix obliqua]|uniref:S1 family peptidase n=1 Tax=Saccharothrix obliqua TaxID=2861747 RepID=UPI001C5FB9A0|nr:serine protease [Saccharothrix obliqua]MBW4718404.1 serine protease [Saccharothrix obliqua]